MVLIMARLSADCLEVHRYLLMVKCLDLMKASNLDYLW